MISLAGFGRAAAAEPPEHLWSRAFSASPVDTFGAVASVSDVLHDPSGGVVIVGTFHGTVDFGGGVLTSRSFDSRWEGADVYAAGFDPAGDHAWSRVILRVPEFLVHSEIIRSLAVDADGNLVIAGTVNGPVDLIDTTLTSTFSDAFVAKFSPDGLQWAKRFGVTGPTGNAALGVAVDNRDIVVTGRMSGRMNFGGGVIQSFGGFDIFLVKLDPEGGHVWSRRYGGANSQVGSAVTIDGGGHIHVAGQYGNPLDFGGGELPDGVFFAAEMDMLANYVGSHVVQVAIGGAGIALDSFELTGDGALILTAGVPSGGSVTLAGQTLYGPFGLAAYFDEFGVYRWHAPWPSGTYLDVSPGNGVAIDLHGSFSGTLGIGDEPIGSVGAYDGFVSRFAPDGAWVWSRAFGGPGDDHVSAVLADGDEELWIGGSFSDGIDFGDVSLSGRGMYLAKFGQRPPTPVLVVTLIPRGSSIEIQWNASGEVELDQYRLLRHHTSQSEPVTVASGAIGAGHGTFVDVGVRPGQRYQYELVVTSAQGDEYRSSLVTVTVPVFANQLAQNAPNPFNPATTIVYSLSQRASVAVSIFDVTGVPIRRIDQGVRDAGEYAVEWDGRDDAGNVVGTGVYFYRLDGLVGVAPKKMVLVK